MPSIEIEYSGSAIKCRTTTVMVRIIMPSTEIEYSGSAIKGRTTTVTIRIVLCRVLR